MATLETAAELLRRAGALPAEQVVPWLAAAAQQLSALHARGVTSTLTLESLRLSPAPGSPPELEPVELSSPSDDVGRAQVRDLASVGYELLKGLPPPEQPADDAWIGVRPELKAILAPALNGSGAATPSLLALQLRALGRAETAGYQAPGVADTQLSAPSSPSAAARPGRAGEIFGTWELLELLGSGGMGDVYRARHVRLGREAAVKVLRDELAALPEVVQRFFQEARVVNEINHPHIVQISDFAEEPRRVYLVMELLQGRSLARLAAEDGPLPLPRIARLMAQACDALQAAHTRGVVHRDVKPDNLFVTMGSDGRDLLKVLDFGVARRLAGDGARTQHGQVLGTPYYMAPEQAAGRAVDARADVYSVGVVLFELISGQDFAQVERPPPLTRTAAGQAVPNELTQLIASCLELDPQRRPASATEVRAVLLQVSEVPNAPRPSTEALAAAAGLAPRRATRVVLGGALVLGVLGAVGWVVNQERAAAPPPAALVTQPANAPTPESAPPVVQEPPVLTAAQPPVVRPPKPKPPRTEPRPVAAQDPLAQRVGAAKQRYERLVQRHGLTQLTSIERAAIAALIDEDAAGPVRADTLTGAEAALGNAERRLEH